MTGSRSSSSTTGARTHPDRGTRPVPPLRVRYRTIFIVDGRRRFASVRSQYDPDLDLVLTYDFGLRHEIAAVGGDARYVDQLLDADAMQDENLRLYRFFERWNLDIDGTDIFEHDGIPFGRSFRLEFWNDFVFHARTWRCLERVLEVKYDTLLVGTSLGEIETVLGAMNRAYVAVPRTGSADGDEFFFAIHEWMAANIRQRGLKAIALNIFAWCVARIFAGIDGLRDTRTRKPSVFVQEYYPTAGIIATLRGSGRVRVIGPTPTRAHLFARYVPFPIWRRRHARAAQSLLVDFRSRRRERLVLGSGTDISESVFRLIESRIAPRMAESVRVIEGATRYLRRDPFRLVLLISNIGEIVTVVDCVCNALGIPSMLIINGLLAAQYGNDSKLATVINAYSPSIRNHYFRDVENVVCLGDPRMDAYPPVPKRVHDANDFTVTIGASGFNPTDLNSYVAVEFDFLYGVLCAIERVRATGAKIRVVIKVRANGSRSQYVRFADEYFPGLVSEIVDTAPMRAVLRQTDLFISIYSQTLFEASCMGIPVVYYRVGDGFKFPPFDGHSELVTVDTVAALEQAIEDFRVDHARFVPFLDRSVMEEYIGPLDGQNLARNLRFVQQFLDDPALGVTS